MKRLLAVVVALSLVSEARADVAPGPGFKRIPAEGKITTEKEYADYIFFQTCLGEAKELKLDPKTPALVTGVGLGPSKSARFVAVPKEARKKFDTEKEFLAAVAKGKIPGMARSEVWFNGQADVKESDTRKVAVTEYKIEKVDPKEGIVFVGEKKDPKDAPKLPVPPVPVKGGSEDDSDDAITYAPKRGNLVAGLAGTFALVLGGLWVARRGRREAGM